MKWKRIIAAVLALVIVAGGTTAGVLYNKNTQKPREEKPLTDSQREVLLQNFEPLSYGEKKEPKRVIDNTHPLNLLNYYGDEPLLDLWSSIPDNQKPYTVMLIIPGHTLLPEREESLKFLEESADICEANKIPYAIQIINGEIANEERMPVAYAESRFAEKHEYFYGLNAAELYNGSGWRGIAESDNSQYIIDCINMCAKYGAFFFWTDTNIGYKNGMVLEWFQTNEAFYSAFKDNSEYICLMNKESFGDPSTYSVMQGLWLAGLIGNWGVASDWWHWTCDGDKKSLFGEYDDIVDNEWDAIMNYPENMYVQSMMLVMSCGGTCFKAEAPNFSTSIGGTAVGGFQYGISPLLDRVIDGTVKIPSREQMLKETRAAVVGKKNYDTFNYNFDNSNLYPETGDYKIIPLLPENLRSEEIKLFNDNDIALINQKATDKILKEYYPEHIDSDTYMTRTDNQWYFINNSENKRVTKKASFAPVLCSAEKAEIEATEHTSAILQEKAEGMYVYLSNYRTDKTEMVRKVTPEYMGDRKWADVCSEFMPIDENGNPIGIDDTKLRTTVIRINGTLNGGAPEVSFRQSQDGSGYQNRPYKTTENWDESTKTLTVTIEHNGIVEMDIKLDKSEKSIPDVKKADAETEITYTNESTDELKKLTEELSCGDPSEYNYYSYLKWNAALEKANVIIAENTYTRSEISKAEKELKTANENLLHINDSISLLKDSFSEGITAENADSFDALLRETISVQPYVDGRSQELNYARYYRDRKYNKDNKQKALTEKMIVLQDK